MFKKIFVATLYILTVFLLTFTISHSVSAQSDETWDGSVANGFYGGSGTEDDPYIIKTPSELAFFAKSVNNGNSYEGEYICLLNDIALNDETFIFDADSGLVVMSDGVNTAYIGSGICGDNSGKSTLFDVNASVCGKIYRDLSSPNIVGYLGNVYSYTPIGKAGREFSGTFNGCGYSVSGLYINNTSKHGCGLFGYVDEGHIENVKIEDSLICAASYVGSLVGSASYSKVCICMSDVFVFCEDSSGGIVGNSVDTDVFYSYNIGMISGKTTIGGIAGINFGNIYDCYNAGAIYSKKITGGIVGQNLGTLSRCYSVSDILESSDIGPIFGYTAHPVESAYYLSTVSDRANGALTSAQMQNKDNFVGFDFENVWKLDKNAEYTYPTLVAISHTGHSHVFSNECDVDCSCGYIRDVSHSFGKEFSRDANSHFKVCTVCGEKNSVEAHKYDDPCDSICNVCNYDRNVFHNFSGAWYTDKSCHWHECTRCGERKDEEAHSPGKEATEDSPQTCKICSYVIAPALGHTHLYTDKWKSDDSGHYKTCSCGETSEHEEHMWDNGTVTKAPTLEEVGVLTYKCTICSHKKTQDIYFEEDTEDTTDIDSDGKSDPSDVISINSDEKRSSKGTSDTSLAISIAALVVSLLNLIMFAVTTVILLKKNQNGRKK